jgi:hypothetical protein
MTSSSHDWSLDRPSLPGHSPQPKGLEEGERENGEKKEQGNLEKEGRGEMKIADPHKHPENLQGIEDVHACPEPKGAEVPLKAGLEKMPCG